MNLDANQLLDQVDKAAVSLANSVDDVERGFAELGWMILEVFQMQYWRVNYDNFGDYVEVVAKKSNKTFEQVYRYFKTVEDLSDMFNVREMGQMGITKAMYLRGRMKCFAIIPPEIAQAAINRDVSPKDLKVVVKKNLPASAEPDGEEFIDLEFAFYVTPEKKKFVDDVLQAAMNTDPVTKTGQAKSAQMWDIFEKIGMEYLGAHSVDGN